MGRDSDERDDYTERAMRVAVTLDATLRMVDANTGDPIPDVKVEREIVMTVPFTAGTRHTVLGVDYTNSEGTALLVSDRPGVIFSLSKRGYYGKALLPSKNGYIDYKTRATETNGHITVSLRPVDRAE